MRMILNTVNKMIVCLCHGVSDREIRAAAREGAKSVKQVGKKCGAGTCCGGCKDDIRDIVKLERSKADQVACGGLLVPLPASA